MTTSYPSGYDTLTSGSLGTTKSNKEPVVDVNYDIDAAEYNTIAGATRQLELKLGDGSGVLTRYGDADLRNVREILDHNTTRLDRACIMDHGTYATSLLSAINTANSAAQVSGGIGVRSVTSVAATIEGFTQGTDHFHQRSSRFRARWYIDALSATNGDYIQVGLYRDGTHYVMFYSSRAGGAWPAWTVEINDGGSADSDTLTATPTAATWTDMEIVTTSSGAYFYLSRGTADEEYVYLSGQAPENGYAAPYVAMISNAGGEVFSYDVIGCMDTRDL